MGSKPARAQLLLRGAVAWRRNYFNNNIAVTIARQLISLNYYTRCSSSNN